MDKVEQLRRELITVLEVGESRTTPPTEEHLLAVVELHREYAAEQVAAGSVEPAYPDILPRWSAYVTQLPGPAERAVESLGGLWAAGSGGEAAHLWADQLQAIISVKALLAASQAQWRPMLDRVANPDGPLQALFAEHPRRLQQAAEEVVAGRAHGLLARDLHDEVAELAANPVLRPHLVRALTDAVARTIGPPYERARQATPELTAAATRAVARQVNALGFLAVSLPSDLAVDLLKDAAMLAEHEELPAVRAGLLAQAVRTASSAGLAIEPARVNLSDALRCLLRDPRQDPEGAAHALDLLGPEMLPLVDPEIVRTALVGAVGAAGTRQEWEPRSARLGGHVSRELAAGDLAGAAATLGRAQPHADRLEWFAQRHQALVATHVASGDLRTALEVACALPDDPNQASSTLRRSELLSVAHAAVNPRLWAGAPEGTGVERVRVAVDAVTRFGVPRGDTEKGRLAMVVLLAEAADLPEVVAAAAAQRVVPDSRGTERGRPVRLRGSTLN